jgi:hypothetical protein
MKSNKRRYIRCGITKYDGWSNGLIQGYAVEGTAEEIVMKVATSTAIHLICEEYPDVLPAQFPRKVTLLMRKAFKNLLTKKQNE